MPAQLQKPLSFPSFFSPSKHPLLGLMPGHGGDKRGGEARERVCMLIPRSCRNGEESLQPVGSFSSPEIPSTSELNLCNARHEGSGLQQKARLVAANSKFQPVTAHLLNIFHTSSLHHAASSRAEGRARSGATPLPPQSYPGGKPHTSSETRCKIQFEAKYGEGKHPKRRLHHIRPTWKQNKSQHRENCSGQPCGACHAGEEPERTGPPDLRVAAAGNAGKALPSGSP